MGNSVQNTCSKIGGFIDFKLLYSFNSFLAQGAIPVINSRKYSRARRGHLRLMWRKVLGRDGDFLLLVG